MGRLGGRCNSSLLNEKLNQRGGFCYGFSVLLCILFRFCCLIGFCMFSVSAFSVHCCSLLCWCILFCVLCVLVYSCILCYPLCCLVLCQVSVFRLCHVLSVCPASCFILVVWSSVLSCLALLSVSRLCWLSCPALMCFTCCLTCFWFTHHLMYLASVFPLSCVRSFCSHALVFPPCALCLCLRQFAPACVFPVSLVFVSFPVFVLPLFVFSKSSTSTFACLPACLLSLHFGPSTSLTRNRIWDLYYLFCLRVYIWEGCQLNAEKEVVVKRDHRTIG